MNVRLLLAVSSLFFYVGHVNSAIFSSDGYESGIYATYSYDNMGATMGMDFDGNGVLYVTQRGTSGMSYNNGSIYKIASDGQATRWVENINGPRRIEWTGGTSYGDNLYVVGTNPREVYSISLDGDVSSFAGISTGPHSITVDRNGYYGGLLYSSTRGTDRIYSISPNGTVNTFSSFPGTIAGGPLDIAFGNYKYNNSMFIAIADSDVGGIYQISSTGENLGLFNKVTSWSNDLEFDLTEKYFGGKLYMFANTEIWQINPDGSQDWIVTGLSTDSAFTFGDDGAMYIAEYKDDNVVITRVVPEPATIIMLGLGGMYLRRRKNSNA